MDIIRYEDLSGWRRLGKGSFGCVSRCELWGTDVAVKEIYSSTEFDWEKYLQREVALLASCRHANIVQFMGTTTQEGRHYIVTEYVGGGNLRSFLWDTTQSFPWKLRLSLSVDIARALAYLHAHDIIHRDLKGENLLLTDNMRVKVADFGFARIAAQNDEEMRRLSYCGTEGYMAPEIILGMEFGKSVDIFSFGVVLCEILSRTLVGDDVFKRVVPGFGIDEDEVKNRASEGCPDEVVQLALQCTHEEAYYRPVIKDVLIKLRHIEMDLPGDFHVGTFRGTRTGPVVEETDDVEFSDAMSVLEGHFKSKTAIGSRFIMDYFQSESGKMSFVTASEDTWNADHPSDIVGNPSTITLRRALDHLINGSAILEEPDIEELIGPCLDIPSSRLDFNDGFKSAILAPPTPPKGLSGEQSVFVNQEKSAVVAAPTFSTILAPDSPPSPPQTAYTGTHRFSIITPLQRRQIQYIVGRCSMCNRLFGVSRQVLACDDCKKFRICLKCSLVPERIPQSCSGDIDDVIPRLSTNPKRLSRAKRVASASVA